jgi:hypothetical protein
MTDYYDSDSENSSESDEILLMQQDEVKKCMKEQDDFDTFLNIFYEAQGYYNFCFLKNVPSCKIYDLIKFELERYPNYNPLSHTMDKYDYTWCRDIIESVNQEVSDSQIYYFYVKIMNLDKVI